MPQLVKSMDPHDFGFSEDEYKWFSFLIMDQQQKTLFKRPFPENPEDFWRIIESYEQRPEELLAWLTKNSQEIDEKRYITFLETTLGYLREFLPGINLNTGPPNFRHIFLNLLHYFYMDIQPLLDKRFKFELGETYAKLTAEKKREILLVADGYVDYTIMRQTTNKSRRSIIALIEEKTKVENLKNEFFN